MAISFDPDEIGFSRNNALYLAHAADVAYRRAPVDEAWDRLGLRAVGFHHKVTRMRGFLGICDTHAVLSFRGSDPVTLQTWLTDAVVKLVERDEYDGRVHHGFSSVLKHTWDKIERLLDDAGDTPLFLTGHSMGGALAVLTACRLRRAGRPPAAVYTFGAPRVGDRAFCAGYRLPTYRIVNGLDLVPEMPLASVKRLLPSRPRLTNEKILAHLKKMAGRVPCYGHVKQLIHIGHDGQILHDLEMEPWHARAARHATDTRGKPFFQGIADHLIANYIRGLEAAPSTQRAETRRRIAVY
jgi:hypothetical protein